MNAKNIISAILMVLSFAACSSDIESLDDNMTNNNTNNGETSISVRMVTEGVSTKAGTTIDPTTEEAAIKNYIIAVFETKSGERVGYLKGSNNTNDIDATKSGVTGLTIGGIDCKAGIVNVVVIANLNTDDEAKFDAVYTYNEFKAQTVNSLDRLVKVGEESNKEISLDNNQSKAITVKLSQLTARVKVSFGEITVNGDNTGVTAVFKPLSFRAKRQKSSAVFSPIAGEGELGESVDLKGAEEFSFYTYMLKNPELFVSANILVFKNTETGTNESTISKNNVSVSFIKDGVQQSVLKSGKAYSIKINATITISVKEDIPCNVEFLYTVHEIEDIEQNIEFS